MREIIIVLSVETVVGDGHAHDHDRTGMLLQVDQCWLLWFQMDKDPDVRVEALFVIGKQMPVKVRVNALLG